MKKLMSSVSGLLILLVLFVAFNVFTRAAITSSRIDLTENKLYTLSTGTKNILAGLSSLKDPLRLRFYFSKALAKQSPPLQSYAQRVQELLEEYVSYSKGKIILEVADPEPFSETEDRAVQYGLKGVPASAAGEMFYFGLAGSGSSPEDEVIEFFQENREEFLEYDVTKLVYNLAHPKKRVVGVLTALPMEGNPMKRMMDPNASSDPWFIVEKLRETFDVRMLPASSEKFDADLDVLLIVHPQNFSPATLYAIDQFVLGGGKAIACVDPFCESQEVPKDPQNPMKSMMADRSSNLGAVMDAWGIEMSKDDLASDREMALPVRWQNKTVEYVLAMGLRKAKDVMSKDDPTTSELETLVIVSAGILKKKDGATTTVTPLIETTKNSMRIPKSKVMFGPNPEEMLESFQPSGEKLMLAARINGPAKTAFPDGKPKKAEDGTEKKEEPAEVSLKESKGPINVIVVSDADFLEDHSWTRVQNFLGQKMVMPTANNADFLINSVDNLSGSNDLISLRSRGRSIRPFDKVVELKREAETQFRAKEKELENKLKDAEKRIQELQAGKDQKGSAILPAEVQKEIAKFQAERVQTRKDLRKVKHELQADIDRLKTKLLYANTAAIPLLVLIAGIVVWWMRRMKLASAHSRS